MKESCWSPSLRAEGAGESCTDGSSHLISASQPFRGKVSDYSRMQKGSAAAGPPAASPAVWAGSSIPARPRELGGPGVTPVSPRRAGCPSGACGCGNKGSWQGTAPPDANLPLASHPLCVSLKIPRRRKFVPRGGCSPPREGLPELPRHENSPQPCPQPRPQPTPKEALGTPIRSGIPGLSTHPALPGEMSGSQQDLARIAAGTSCQRCGDAQHTLPMPGRAPQTPLPAPKTPKAAQCTGTGTRGLWGVEPPPCTQKPPGNPGMPWMGRDLQVHLIRTHPTDARLLHTYPPWALPGMRIRISTCPRLHSRGAELQRPPPGR